MLASPTQQTYPTQGPETAAASSRIVRGHSCVLCQQRKVKCDRQKPCSNCVKARAECIPSVPTVPRRRRRKFSEQDLATRLRRYEHLLKKNGIKVDDDDSSEGGHPVRMDRDGCPLPSSGGVMLADKEHSRYVENTLWEHLRDEIIEDPREVFQASSEEDSHENEIYPHPEALIVEQNTAPKDLSALHPQTVHIFRLWQTYLTNCNPLTKFFHAPTMQQVILDASSNIQNIPRHTEALMFAIYLLSVTSLTNEECEATFNQSRNDLLLKYSQATRQALVNARFLKSLSLSTLQAFCIYLLALRKSLDHQSLWVLTGCAVRIAVRLGIQHDGTAHNIPPFESEIRTRTWWQVVFLDGQASKLAGAGFPTWLGKYDTKKPLNVSDSDLSPTMKEIPPEREGATEMIFCNLRTEVSVAYKTSGSLESLGIWHLSGGAEKIAEKDRAIDELETRFQEKYVRYCDPSIPLHMLCIYMTKSVISSMRLLAHHPRQYPDKGASMPQREKDMLWIESLKELEILGMSHTEKSIQGFRWHTYVQFHLDSFILVLSELRQRTSGELVERAWRQIEFAYEQRPEMLTDNKNTLYFAMGSLCLKAWTKYEEAGGRYEGTQLLPVPRYISKLRTQRKIPEPAVPPPPQLSSQQPTPESLDRSEVSYAPVDQMVPLPDTTYGYNAYDTSSTDWNKARIDTTLSMPEVSLVDWEYWQTLMDGDLPNFTGDPNNMNFDAGQGGWIN